MSIDAIPMCDLICVGLIVADHVCAPIRKFPAPGGLITTPKLELSIGGCAANVSTDAAKVGLAVTLVGCIGEDPLGRYVLDELRFNGVNCDHVHISATSQTAATMVVNIEGEDRRFIHAVGANTELTGQEISDDLLSQSKMVYVGGFGLNRELSGKNVRDLFRRAHQQGVTTVLDVVLDDIECCRDMLLEALPETDLFLPNCDEARLLTGVSDTTDQAKAFLDQGANTVVITAGADGAISLDQEQNLLKAPAFPVEQVDGTGGGDAFVAGYLYGLNRSATPEECLRYGSAMGASCVQHAGATTGVFNAEELEEFVKKHS